MTARHRDACPTYEAETCFADPTESLRLIAFICRSSTLFLKTMLGGAKVLPSGTMSSWAARFIRDTTSLVGLLILDITICGWTVSSANR